MKNCILILLAVSVMGCSDRPRFKLLGPGRTGIDFENTITPSDTLHVMNFEYIYNGAGVGIMDLNNDGMQDIVFTGNQVPPRVYLNEGNFRFTDISSSFPGLDNGQWYSGITYVDINNDGWIDLYFTCTAYEDAALRKNRFYVCQGLDEQGVPRYREMAEEYGIDDDSYSVHAAFFDYDLDGDLDLYVMNNWMNDRLSASYRPKKNDGTALSNDDLYRNNGDGTFTNVTLEAGIIYEGFGLGLALGDVNKDGYPDIFVSNDYMSNDLLYINQRDGTFTNEIATYMSYQAKSSMGNDMADIDNDGNPDMFTLDMMPEEYHKKKQTINGFPYLHYINDARYGYEHQYLRNMLNRHNGFIDGELVPYSEIGQLMGIFETDWSWSPLFADYDNDGDKDLLITNGYPRDLTDKDWTHYRAEALNFASPKTMISKAPRFKTRNNAFENAGGLRFIRRSDEWFDPIPSFSYGAAFADLDGDGDLDYVVNNLNDAAFVYRNMTRERNRHESNFIQIKLIGAEGNIPAFGAKIEVWSGGNYQFQEHFLSRGYASTVDPVVHFGLGTHPVVDSVKVTWPTGDRFSIEKAVPANRMITLDERQARPVVKESLRKGNPGLPFVHADSLLDYVHQQKDFIDFYQAQKIIPHKFSQIGPRMKEGDLNGDGLTDILVGATNSLPTTLYIRDGEGFRIMEAEGLSGLKPFSEADFAIIDIDLDGDMDVVAISGGYENPDESIYVHYLYENNHGVFTPIPLPIPPFVSSVVRPFDFNRDGYPDLFIGARVKHSAFPLSPDSWILMNDSGTFSRKNAMPFDLGMVTDAVWCDYDGDGWEDLVVAREWNSLKVLRNMGGESFEEAEIPGMESMHGIWYSVTAGDFDGDGDMDMIAGNLGDNHRFLVNDQYPLRTYVVDLDMNGILDPIPTAYWKDRDGKLTEYPVHYLDELSTQSNYFLQKFWEYTTFSFASFEEVLDSAILSRVSQVLHVNTTSSYILWNDGGGSFRWEKLPRQAQVAPITRTIVRDLNGDHYPDVILAGNDHTYDVSTGYYDALKGLVLLSRDKRPLDHLQTPAESGLLLHGMVESLLWLDGERPLIVAGLNRDSIECYYFNGYRNTEQ